MKYFYSLILILCFTAGQQVLAQSQGKCGFVPTAEMIQRTLANKAAAENGMAIDFRDGITYVPIKFHLISKLDGSFRVDEDKVYDALCYLNTAYFDLDIQFYVYQGFSYINNDVAWGNPEDNEFLLNSRKAQKAVNIYIGNTADSGSGGPGTTLAYYNPNNDWIISRRSEVNGSSATLAHELGHFFSLLHTFNGWECAPWDASIHGNPVSSSVAPCPSLEDGEPVDVELADGSNCDTSGDFLCDTPADYNFGLFDNDDCVYNYNCMDPAGNTMAPMEDNYMSYFQNCATYQFTPDQGGLIAADLASRNILDTDFTPPATEITEVPVLEYPINGEVVAYNTVNFNWTDVAGADRYILEYDIDAGFNLIAEQLIVWGSFKSIDGTFLENKQYYWRVRPLNSYYACAGWADGGSFMTNDVVAVNEIAEVKGWKVMPNPVASGQSLQIELHASSAFAGQVLVQGLDGRRVYNSEVMFVAGENQATVSTNGLAAGIYLVSVITEHGVVTERVVIGR